MQDNTRIAGHWTLVLYDPKGTEKDRREGHNLITNAGLDYLRSYAFLGCSPTYQPDPMCYIAIGSDATTETATDTALGSELARQDFDTVTEGGVGVVTVETTFNAGVGTGAITEVGILNASSGGDLFNRRTFSAVNKAAGDTLKVSCSLTFSAA